MFVGITCPRCSQALKLPEERVGSQVRCPACRERFAFDAATFATASGDPSTEARMRAAQERSGGVGRASSRLRERIADLIGLQSGVGKGATDVSVLMSGIGGIALALILYAVFYQLDTPMIRALFLVGWVPKAIVFLSSWSIVILVWKFFRVRAQQSTILFDALPRDLGDEINQGNVEKFRQHLLGLPPELSSNFLLNRVQRGVDHYRSGRGVQDVSASLNVQAELDAMAVDSSYTMLRAFIWAVPILGFIGTVIGIGESVMGFSTSLDQAQNIEVIRESLGGVTSGLSTAFNTTLIALAASIILMLPAHWLQKLEDDLLNSVSDYCNEELIGRLEEVHDVREDSTAAVVREVMTSVLERQNETFDQWTRSLAGIGATLTADVAKGLHKVEQDIQEGYKARALQFGEAIGQVAARSNQELEQMTQSLQQTWIQLQDGMSQRVQEVLGKIQESGLESTREVRETIERSAASQEELLAQLGPTQERHAEAMAAMLTQMESTVAEVNAGLASLHDRHATGLDSLAGSLEKNLDLLSRQAGEGWNRLESSMQERQKAQVEAIGNSVTNVTDRAKQQLEEITRRLQENSASMQQETVQRCNELLSGFGESGKTSARELSEALTRSAEAQEAQQRALSESLARVDTSAAELQRNFETIQRAQAEGLERMTRSLGENLNQLQERADRDGRARTTEIDEKAGAVRQGMVDLERRAGELVNQIGRLAPTLEQQIGRLSGDLANQAKDQVDALGRASQGITSELRSVAESLERSASSSGTHMEGTLNSIREVQSELSRSLPETMNAQRQALEQSKDHIERLVETQRRLADNLDSLRSDDRLARTLADLGGLAKNLSGDIDGLQRKLSEASGGDDNGNGKGGFRLPFFKRGPARN